MSSSSTTNHTNDLFSSHLDNVTEEVDVRSASNKLHDEDKQEALTPSKTSAKPSSKKQETPKKVSAPMASAPTPMMAQYLEIKAANPDCLLFYRMGDFYELFLEDAKRAAGPLGLTLTKRGKHLGEDIAMAGVPVHAVDDYFAKAIQAGFKVAVAEQMEDPAEAKKRGSKSVVKRDIVRLITPGTLTEDHLLDASANNYLTALFLCPSDRPEQQIYVAASLDISTGDFLIDKAAHDDLFALLARLSPRELILPDGLYADQALYERGVQMNIELTPVASVYFDSGSGQSLLEKALGVASLDGFGSFDRFELAAISALFKYVEITQIGQRPIVRAPRRAAIDEFMLIDGATGSSLELLRTSRGEKRGSLLHAIDRTITASGSRLLANWLSRPSNKPEIIKKRQDAVQFFLEKTMMRGDVRQSLKGLPDMARALSRLSLGRGSPRDMGAIRFGLGIAAQVYDLLQKQSLSHLPEDLLHYQKALLFGAGQLAAKLDDALLDELPVLKRDGNFIRSSFHDDLAQNRKWRDEGRQAMEALQQKYREETGVRQLKIKQNNQLGYYIEVTKTHSDRLMTGPLSDLFRHRQTLLNAMRFSTQELIETQSNISLAGERAVAIELELFDQFVEELIVQEDDILQVADSLSHIDVLLSLAQLAEDESYHRPLVDDGLAFQIDEGRHPVVEQALRRESKGAFVGNNCLLVGRDKSSGQKTQKGKKTAPQLILLTGPNMAGKSTYLRQNALIAILAQIGSFVPAKTAHIGVIDRLFSRVGASDDLARGHSTFMVEMVETAAILNQASCRSLVILDEIGRGTATFDGLSIAWACVEYLHDQCGCRSLFATHYHELTDLKERLKSVANFTIAVKEWQDDIIFLHEVKEGSADRSYGIQVAKLAGLPASVIARAHSVLTHLEDSGQSGGNKALLGELPLFSKAPKAQQTSAPQASQVASPLYEKLDELNPDSLTPKQALDLLYELKKLRHDDK